jgi:hypothetical protein
VRCGLGGVECEEKNNQAVSFHEANWTDIANLRLCIIFINKVEQLIRQFRIKVF